MSNSLPTCCSDSITWNDIYETTRAWRPIKKKLDHWIFGKLVDQLQWELEKELLGKVDSVLDLGCGSRSYIGYFKQQIKRTVGVDLF